MRLFGSRLSPALSTDPRRINCSCGEMLFPDQVCPTCYKKEQDFEARCKELYESCKKVWGDHAAQQEVAELRRRHEQERKRK